MSGERWKPVTGYEGLYEISDRGRVHSLDRIDNRGRRVRGRIMRDRLLPDGRARVALWRVGRGAEFYTSVLMLEAFVGPRPPHSFALHWDDDTKNNSLENLRWGTHAENMSDMVRNGHGNAGITNCPAGHEYTPDNTYINPNPRPHRHCKECRRIRDRRAYRAKKKAA